MENLKIKLNGKKEGDLAQKLFFDLGYGFEGCKNKTIQILEYMSDYYFFAYACDMDLTHSCDYGVFMNKPHKEITLQELRDMVVLKRNDDKTEAFDNKEMCEGGSKPKHSHYKKNVSHLNVIDPYRIADLYDLHPCADHIAKKALCTGKRGHKDLLRDIQDIIDTAERWKEMIEEDNREI